MIANYHTHTPRCHHAYGSEEAYVQSAVAAKLELLGFSDHTPYPFPSSHVSTFRMGMEQLQDYCDTVLKLKAQYADQIRIHLGVEAEYYPKYFPELLAILRDSPVEYMLLGQHCVGNEIGQAYCGWETAELSVLEQYCDQCIDGLYTGLFTYLAHPDLIHFVGDANVYEAQMQRICRAAKACDLPLEINLLGLREGRHYPDLRFWALAGEEGCQVILGSDAHRPEAVHDPETEQKALAIAAKFGLKVLPTVPLRPLK